MKILGRLAVLLGPCLLLPGCMAGPDAALARLRAARQEMAQVAADRQSAAALAPLQEKIARTFGALHKVTSCECLIHPEVIPWQQLNPDKSVTYGLRSELCVTVIVETNAKDAWKEEAIREEVSKELRENGLKEFTLFPPRQFLSTWIIEGWAPQTAEFTPAPEQKH